MPQSRPDFFSPGETLTADKLNRRSVEPVLHILNELETLRRLVASQEGETGFVPVAITGVGSAPHKYHGVEIKDPPTAKESPEPMNGGRVWDGTSDSQGELQEVNAVPGLEKKVDQSANGSGDEARIVLAFPHAGEWFFDQLFHTPTTPDEHLDSQRKGQDVEITHNDPGSTSNIYENVVNGGLIYTQNNSSVDVELAMSTIQEDGKGHVKGPATSTGPLTITFFEGTAITLTNGGNVKIDWDPTKISGFDGTKEQYLKNDSGTVKWVTKTDC